MDPSTSDGADKPKRKRRTKEEIEQEKVEKEMKKIRREMNAAKNSKCEQFLFCYVDRAVFIFNDGIETEINTRFTERAISSQLAFVDGDYGFGKIVWKRKRIDAVLEDGKVKSLTTLDLEGHFIHVVDEGTFGKLTKNNNLAGFIDKITKEHCHQNAIMTLVVYGQGGPRDTVVSVSFFTLKLFVE
uniref:Uncharacterized protein n=1 Tax=Panagrolaimus sp. JU765 TaxID=591449 RepID=A0AC34R7C3_9BILA